MDAGSAFVFLFMLYFLIGMCSAPYFWLKKTNSGSSPLGRRMIAVGYGMAWPYYLVKAIQGKSAGTSGSSDVTAAAARILPPSSPAARPAGTSTTPMATSDDIAPTAPKQSKIANPFDN